MQRDGGFDVAVVGFGPSGAVAVGLLAGMGLRVWVCDRSRVVYDKPRAIAVDHEILRVFQQLGISDAVAPHIEPFTPSEYFGVDGQLIKRLTMVEPPYPLGHTPSNVFTQPPVEAALRAHVLSMPNACVALATEVTRVEQDAQGAVLTWRADDAGSGAATTGVVRARFVVACDGASSSVREQVGIGLQDLSFDEPWLVVDVLVNARGLAKLPTTSVQYCEPARPCTMVSGPGNHRRWEISLRADEDPQKVIEPAETWKLLSRWLTPDDGELWRQASYRFHALVADTWRNGRVFVAGDAAHQQPPFLGQGMCQGVRDVANLAWKLAAVCKGDVQGAAADALLDSYGIERKQHVVQLTTRIKAIGAVICERDEAKARRRDAQLLAECGGVVRDVPRQDVIPALECGFLASVPDSGENSSDNNGNDSGDNSRYASGTGTLFPQPWIVHGSDRVRFDVLAGNGWWLVLDAAFEGQAPDFAAHGGLGLKTMRLGPQLRESDGVAAAWFRRHGCRAAIVRPDRYVYGVASTGRELDAQLGALAARLGLQPASADQREETTTWR